MPLFDYHCTDCDTTREVLVPLESPKTLPCSCGGKRERRFGIPSFVLNWGHPVTGENMRAPLDNPEEVWGQPTDGVNETQYKTKKTFFDAGNTGGTACP